MFMFVYCHLFWTLLLSQTLVNTGGPTSREYKKLQLDFVYVRRLAKKHLNVWISGGFGVLKAFEI